MIIYVIKAKFRKENNENFNIVLTNENGGSLCLLI